MDLAFIPSPSDGVWHLGPLPLRAYALAIILGIVVAIWVGERRFVARGGRAGQVSDIAVWAIPFGLVGARIYHVATNPEFYFGDGKDPIQALYVWEGGLGIWGAIAFGALGAYLGCRFAGVRFTSFLDAVAPGVVLAQAIGRWGNYFNQELFGKPTDQPWGLEIDLDNRPEAYLEYSTFHPTFLYESLLCIAVAIIIVLADRRFQLGRGRVFALYVALYTAGRAYIEDLRIDDAHEFAGYRLNIWVALGLFVLAVAYFIIVGRRRPGREESVYREGREPVADADAKADDEAADADDKDRVKAKVGAGASAEAGEASGDDNAGESGKPETTSIGAGESEGAESKPGKAASDDMSESDETSAVETESDKVENDKVESTKAEGEEPVADEADDSEADAEAEAEKTEVSEPESEESGADKAAHHEAAEAAEPKSDDPSAVDSKPDPDKR
jgi:prolipoprotein diacylglyceryl transferase